MLLVCLEMISYDIFPHEFYVININHLNMKKKMLLNTPTEKIRYVSESDLEEVMAIEKSCYSQPWSCDMMLQEIANPVSRFICYVENQKICGYLCYWYVLGEVEILNLATDVGMQRRGIAESLIKYAFAAEDEGELTGAFLEVRSGNLKAIALYEKLGFRKTGVRRSYYRNGEDAILMTKAFAL